MEGIEYEYTYILKLRYSPCTIKFTLLKYHSVALVYSQDCATIITSNAGTFCYPKMKPNTIGSHTSVPMLTVPVFAVQLLSHVLPSATPWTAACQASLSFTISWSFLTLTSIEWVMPSNHFILCRPLLLLPSIFPSIRVFSNEVALHIWWPKYWSTVPGQLLIHFLSLWIYLF